MKKAITVLVALLIMLVQTKTTAQEISTTSKVTDVMVYRNMARETRHAEVNLKAGYNEVRFTKLARQMIDQSLQVSVRGSAELLTATPYSATYTDPKFDTYDDKVKMHRDSMHAIDHEVKWVSEQRAVANGEIALLTEWLKPTAGKESVSAAEINSMADVYRNRITELKRVLFEFVLEDEKLQLRKNSFQEKINELGAKEIISTKDVVLTFESSKAETIELDIIYLCTDASWTPIYDLSVSSTDKPVDVLYKAKVWQFTSFDWKDVNMSLSTITPGIDNNRPLMAPKYIDYVTYRFNPVTSGAVTNSMQAQVFTPDELAVAPEIEVAEIDEQLEFKIEKRQTVFGSGKEHVCQIQKLTIPATYKYHVVPKVNPTAFLLAKIADYGKYNLLAGDANIFYRDTYVGQVKITPNSTTDTLLVSLGREDRIVVKRNRVLNKTSKKTLDDAVRDDYAWEIKVRNNKSTAIEIEVLDQIPLSRRNEIKVKKLDTGGAEYLEDYGRLLWNLKIPANQTKTVEFSYYIQYPKGKIVEEL